MRAIGENDDDDLSAVETHCRYTGTRPLDTAVPYCVRRKREYTFTCAVSRTDLRDDARLGVRVDRGRRPHFSETRQVHYFVANTISVFEAVTVTAIRR